ncbi:MAG: tetratricopeptide repeat protein [Peptostreptococcaceae bacterium]
MINNIYKAAESLKKLDFDLALEFIHSSYDEDEDLSQIHNLLGIYYELLGDFNLARKHYRASIELEPGSSSSMNNLQRVCEYKNICSLEYIDFGNIGK